MDNERNVMLYLVIVVQRSKRMRSLPTTSQLSKIAFTQWYWKKCDPSPYLTFWLPVLICYHILAI